MTWNRILLVLMACIAVALGWRLYAEKHADRGRLQVLQEEGAVVLSWRSPVDIPMRTRFAEAIDRWRGETRHFVVDLDSPGGSLREGRLVIEQLQDLKKTHKVTTHVGPGNQCLSMCVPIFLQGQDRVAASTSQWMFHEPGMYDVHTGIRVEGPDFEQRALSRRFYDRYFRDSPIDARWREELQRSWRGKDIWKTGRQLAEEKSNIVTRLYE